MLRVRFVEGPAELHLHVEDAMNGRGISLEDHVLGAVLAAAQVCGPSAKLRHEDAHRWRCCCDVRESFDVLCPFREQLLAIEPLAWRMRKRGPREAVADDRVGAELANAGEHIVVQAVDHGADSDYRGDANHDSENS